MASPHFWMIHRCPEPPMFKLRIGKKILDRLDDACLHPIVLQRLKYLLSREPGCPFPNFFIDFILVLFSCRYRFKPWI